jgi:hypothetical protein
MENVALEPHYKKLCGNASADFLEYSIPCFCLLSEKDGFKCSPSPAADNARNKE